MLEPFKTPKLPTMLEGSVMCVDAKTWNQLVNYVNTQSNTINDIIHSVNSLISSDKHQNTEISIIAKALEEFLE